MRELNLDGSTLRFDAAAPKTLVAKAGDARIGDIQVLRGIAIVMVLFYHLSLCREAFDLFPVRVTLPFYLGVEIFFVVSGYVITRSLLKDGFDGRRFFVKRVFRLMPALLCFVVLTLALNRYVRSAGLSEAMTALFSVPDAAFGEQARAVIFGYFTLIPPPVSYANGAMWSLSVEDQFYAGVTLLCLATALFRLGGKRTASFVALAAAALYVGLSVYQIAGLIHPGWVAPAALRYLAVWKFDLLAAGVLLALIDARFSPRLRTHFAETGPYVSAFALLLPLFLAALCESPMAAEAPVLHGIGYLVMGLSFSLLVLLAANGLAFPASRGPLYKALRFVGDRSYTYYLFHFPLFIVAWIIFQRLIPSAFNGAWHYAVAQLLCVTALLVPFAEIIYRRVELPLAELGRALARRLERPAIADSPVQRAARASAAKNVFVE